MIRNGNPLFFSIESVSLLDINALIDKGRRFTLVAEDDINVELDRLEEYLKNESKVAIHER